MNIRTIPEPFTDDERLHDDFEARNIAPSAADERLGANLVSVLKDIQPTLVRSVAPLAFTILLNGRPSPEPSAYGPFPDLCNARPSPWCG